MGGVQLGGGERIREFKSNQSIKFQSMGKNFCSNFLQSVLENVIRRGCKVACSLEFYVQFGLDVTTNRFPMELYLHSGKSCKLIYTRKKMLLLLLPRPENLIRVL